MDFNTIMMFVGAAVCILPVVFMLGYVHRERQHGKIVSECEKNVAFQRHTLIHLHQADIEVERNNVRELEIALVQSSQAVEAESNAFKGMKDQWAYSNGYRKALVQAMLDFNLWDFSKHRDDPAAMIKLLREHAAKLAVDPQLNKAAKNLHTRGVRKGAAMGRKQMAKLMQKSIDNQAQSIEGYAKYCTAQAKEMCEQATEYDIYRAAVETTIADKIALPGVRKAFKIALCVELDRRKSVNRSNEE